jgi:hypothetical protein
MRQHQFPNFSQEATFKLVVKLLVILMNLKSLVTVGETEEYIIVNMRLLWARLGFFLLGNIG